VVSRFLLVGVGALLVTVACSHGSDTSAPGSTSTTPSPPPTAAPPDVLPNATVSFSGDAGMAGDGREPSVRCNWPDVDGSSIAVLATPPDGSALARIQLRGGYVKVFLGSTSGDYHERAFTGTGVTSFDSATGARIDSTLTETDATAGTTAGDLGAITAIHGDVACGDQTPGSSTVTISGETADGVLSHATLDPVRVECDATAQGNEVAAAGITTVGSTKVLVSIGLTSDGAITVDKALPSGHRRYTASGSATIASDGAHLSADAVEQGAPAPMRTLHLEGDLSCGRNASG
jgi:hypothetical protein